MWVLWVHGHQPAQCLEHAEEWVTGGNVARFKIPGRGGLRLHGSHWRVGLMYFGIWIVEDFYFSPSLGEFVGELG